MKSTKKSSIAAMAVALVVGLPAISIATPLESMKVTAAGLDLNTPAGAHSYYSRLQIAAMNVCGAEDQNDAIRGASYERCYRSTLAQAVKSVQIPLVTKIFNDKYPSTDVSGAKDAGRTGVASN